MKKTIYALLACVLAGGTASAQLSITAADMPVSGDTLRWSSTQVSPTTNISVYSQTSPAYTWNFTSLSPIAQSVDAYKTAISVSPLYFSISATAYGYKVADSLAIPNLPISVKEVYTFFNKKTSPARYIAEGFGAKISTIPIPATYSDEDEIYFFPLTFNRTDTSTYKLDVSISGIGRLVQNGRRITKVDGEGTIQTPYTTAPVACLRIRTEVVGVDSLIAPGISIPLPRNTVEYKWLAKGEHYPLLWVTATVTGTQQTPTSVSYRDVARSSLGVGSVTAAPQSLSAYVDPSNHLVKLFLPASWNKNTIEMFDLSGRTVVIATNATEINGSNLAAGTYLIRVTTAQGVGFAKVVL